MYICMSLCALCACRNEVMEVEGVKLSCWWWDPNPGRSSATTLSVLHCWVTLFSPNLWSYCFYLLSARVIGVYHHTVYVILDSIHANVRNCQLSYSPSSHWVLLSDSFTFQQLIGNVYQDTWVVSRAKWEWLNMLNYFPLWLTLSCWIRKVFCFFIFWPFEAEFLCVALFLELTL